MGADLFITRLFEQQRQQWEPEFEKAASARDEAVDEASRTVAQARVERAYEQMYSRGYFRDPYNDWDLLWNFGLSWWQDVIPMLDKEAWLSVERAQGLLAMLKQRENIFELNLAQLPAEKQRYFRRRYADLQRFLNQAIALNAPIKASL